jgi:PAS domain S-box-containing protein
VVDPPERQDAALTLARQARLLELASDAIFVRDMAGRITYWSRGAEALYGWSKAEALGNVSHELLHTVFPRPLAEVEAIVTHTGYWADDIIHTRRDGTQVVVASRWTLERDRAGRPRAILELNTDVTEHKQAEEQARQLIAAEAARAEAEAARQRWAFLAQVSTLFASSLDYEATLARLAQIAVPTLGDLCIIDMAGPDGTIQRMAVAHVAAPREERLRQVQLHHPPTPGTPHPVLRVLATGQPEVLAEVSDSLLAAIACNREHLQAIRDLGYKSALVVPLMASGRVLGALSAISTESPRAYGPDDLALAQEFAGRAAMAIDNARVYAAERRARAAAEAAEASYRGLFEGVADTILVCDAAGRIVDANRPATELLGYSLDELRQLRLLDICAMPPGWLESEYARFVDEGDWRGEAEVHTKGHARVPVEIRATAAESPDGRRYVSVLRDISERRALEQLQREFFATIAHDLKNPLAAIKGRVQLLLRRAQRAAPRPEDLTTALTAIEAATNTMQRMLDQLMYNSREQFGQSLMLQRDDVELRELVARLVDQQRATTDRHELHVEATEQGAVVGYWDGNRLERVVSNLLGNAIKYSPEGGRVVVSVQREEDETGPYALLTVRDEGPGIPAEDLPRVFERFHRGSNVAGRIPGTGLGLAGVRSIVEQHGGSISLDSREGAGTTVTVRLPLARGGP